MKKMPVCGGETVFSLAWELETEDVEKTNLCSLSLFKLSTENYTCVLVYGIVYIRNKHTRLSSLCVYR